MRIAISAPCKDYDERPNAMNTTKETKHTPGPWRVERFGLDHDPLAITAGHGMGEMIVATTDLLANGGRPYDHAGF